MARANNQFTGLRWYTPDGTVGMPQPIPCFVASAYATADIYVGDPVQWVSDGSVIRTPAGSGNGSYGVVSSILQFRNAEGVLVRNGRYLPSGTTWTAFHDRSMLMVIPCKNNLFSVQADEGTTITTAAAARDVVGENCDHIYTAATANQGLGLGTCLLDISTNNTTDSLQWRVYDFLEGPGNDPTVTRATYIVYANVTSNRGAIPSNTGL